jgi:hypothetical protein
MAEWQKWTMAQGGILKDIADTAGELATQIKTTSVLASTAMGAVKLVAELQSTNLFIKALDAVADELLDQLEDWKEAGYYYLLVDPYFTINVTPTKSAVYGIKQERNRGGDRLWWDGVSDDTITPNRTTSGRDKADKPRLITPHTLVPGGWNPYQDQTIDPYSALTPFPQFTANQVIKSMQDAFDDKGDVPKYEVRTGGSKVPKTGNIVYDEYGDPYTGWDTNKKFSIQLYDIGSNTLNFKSDRDTINNRVRHGKPNVRGNTEFGGGSSAIAIIIAAPSYKVFAESFFAFSQMFTDIPEFANKTIENILDTYNKMQAPDPITLLLTECDTNYGLFAVGDIVGGQKTGLGKIKSINSESQTSTSKSTAITKTITDDYGQLKEITEFRDDNPDGRWQDMEISVEPILTSEGLQNIFTIDDGLRDQEAHGTWGTLPDEGGVNYQIKGEETRYFPKNKRIFSKCGVITMQKLEVPTESITPDFGGIQIKTIIPYWAEFFEMLEGFILQVKGFIATSTEFIQDMIDAIEEIIKFLDDMISTIEDFLKFFSIDLSGAGIYALHIKDQPDGNSGLQAELGSSELPRNLTYAAGLLFVGVEVAGFNPIDAILAPILGLVPFNN